MTKQNNNEDLAWSGRDWILLGTNVIILLVMYFIFNEQLPDAVGSHFNSRGELDRTMSKSGFWLLYGGIGVVLPSFLLILRFADPRGNNYIRFEGYFYLMRWAISLFLHGVMLMVILTNLHYELPMLNLLLGAFGILWIVLGNRMGQLRSNFFIGVKTPWAIVDENNWRSTHRLSARLWFAAGLIMFISAWFIPTNWIMAILLTCVLASSLIPAGYSYVLYLRKKKV